MMNRRKHPHRTEPRRKNGLTVFLTPETFCNEVQLINNVVIVSGEQQRDSAIHIRVSIPPQTPLPSRLPQSIEKSSLCSTGGPCWLCILQIAVQTQFLSPKPYHISKTSPLFWYASGITSTFQVSSPLCSQGIQFPAQPDSSLGNIFPAAFHHPLPT